MKNLTKIILFILLLLPIIDYYYVFVLGMQTGPNVMIRGTLTLLFFGYIIKNNPKNIFKNPFNVWLGIFTLMLTLYLLLSGNLIKNFYIYIKMLYWIFGYYYFYILSFKNFFKTDDINIFGRILLFVSFAIILLTLPYRFADDEGWLYEADNIGYLILFTLPYLVIKFDRINNNILQYVILLGTAISMKRGAQIGAVASYLFMWFYFIFRDKSYNLYKSLFTILIIAVSVFVLFQNMEIFEERYSDINDPEKMGSGRGTLWPLIYNAWEDGHIFHQAFGNGFYSSGEVTRKLWDKGFMAHSDWLEVLYGWGIFGIIVYVMLIYSIIKSAFIVKKLNVNYYISVIIIFLIFLSKGTFGGTFNDIRIIYLLIPLGFILGTYDRAKYNNLNNNE